MSRGLSFFASGLPKGQPRPRAFAMHGKARVYDPGTAEAWKSAIAVAAEPFLSERFTRPIRFSCMFVFPRPKSHFRTGKRSAELREDAPPYNASKPDIDNALKAVMDALVAIGLIADDALIVQVESAKLYSFGARTGALVTISEADDLFASTCQESLSASFKSARHREASGISGVPFPGAETLSVSQP